MNTDITSLLVLPFMQRAIIAGLLLAFASSIVGVFAVLRRSSLLGDAMSHSALFGVALGILLGIHPVFTAALVVMSVAVFLPLLTQKSGLPADNIFGFLLPFSMALGVLTLAFVPGYQPDLVSFLFGSILSVSWMDIAVAASLTIAVILCIIRFYRPLLSVSFDRTYAKLSGISSNQMDLLYHLLLASAIIIGVRIVGTVLINALCIIPASTVRLFARSLKDMFIWTPVVALGTTLIGLLASALLNVPSGPAIVVVSGVLFIGAIFVKRL
jgi:zinc transport system permease protein